MACKMPQLFVEFIARFIGFITQGYYPPCKCSYVKLIGVLVSRHALLLRRYHRIGFPPRDVGGRLVGTKRN
mgnify:CR=1 FL=1